MARTRETVRPECDPGRVRAEVTRLHVERLARRKPPAGCSDFAAQSDFALWMAGWHERYRAQQILLVEWARCTGQPAELRRAIYGKEREAFAKCLIARARAAQWQREAAQRAIRSSAGPGLTARSAA